MAQGIPRMEHLDGRWQKPAHTYESAMARIDLEASKVQFGHMSYDLPASRKQQGKEIGVTLERGQGVVRTGRT